MPKKKLEENTEESLMEEPIMENTPDIIIDKPFIETEIPTTPVVPKKEKVKGKVILIAKKRIIIVDEDGNSIAIPLTDKNKNLKIGDTYYL
jgi:hypothetical protein